MLTTTQLLELVKATDKNNPGYSLMVAGVEALIASLIKLEDESFMRKIKEAGPAYSGPCAHCGRCDHSEVYESKTLGRWRCVACKKDLHGDLCQVLASRIVEAPQP